MAKSRGSALRTYILRRILLMIPTFLGITFAVFMLCQFVPGGPIDQLKMRMAGEGSGVLGAAGGSRVVSSIAIPEDQLNSLKAYYGFDKPLLVRYGIYLKKLLTLDLGTSFRFTEPVTDTIKRRLPVSLFYGSITTLLTYMICIPLGIWKALRHKSAFDNSSSFVIFLLYSIPGYALGTVLLAFLAVQHDWFPLAGFQSENHADLNSWGKIKDLMHHATLPLICWSMHIFAVMTILMKNSLMENMSADYVKTALAKGLSWPRAVLGHAVRNSLIPLATSFGNNLAVVLAGSLLIERVFNIPGMGLLFFESITSRDYPVVMGFTVIGACLQLLGNLVSDLTVAAVDPRVRFE